MAKRFASTLIWGEDWFLDMPTEYKLFWFYMLSSCDHAGLFKVNLRSFCTLNGVNLTSTEALNYFNKGKDRIRVVNQSLWLIEDFFVFQYGSTFNINNRMHMSIKNEYDKYQISLTSIRGLKDLKDRVKDKEKEINKESSIRELETSSTGSNTQEVNISKDSNVKNSSSPKTEKNGSTDSSINGRKPFVNPATQGQELYAERFAKHKAEAERSGAKNRGSSKG